MSNPKDWAEVAAEEILDHPKMVNRDLTLSDYANAIRIALAGAGYVVVSREDAMLCCIDFYNDGYGCEKRFQCRLCDTVTTISGAWNNADARHSDDCPLAALAPQERT